MTKAVLALSWALASEPPHAPQPDGVRYADLVRLHRDGLAKLTNAEASDDQEGFSLVLRAAQAGLAAAQYDVATSYETGRGVAQSFQKEVEWLTRAAVQGMPDAEYKLATCYRTGHGVGADPAKAFYWYRLAAEQGDAEAQNNVATAYVRGDGTDKNVAEAVRWYERALGRGYLPAGKSLIVSYLTTEPPDYFTAEKWILVLQARRKDLTSPFWRDFDAARSEVERHLPPDRIAAARDQADAWIQRNGTAAPWLPKEVRPASSR
jgi:TPR repeat protein